MRRAFAIVAASAAFGLVTATSFAQNPQPAPPTQVVVPDRLAQKVEGAAVPSQGNTFIFVSSEFGFGGKTVKGAPYSAEAITETVQTLGDGNRIINRTTSSLYRDSEGRTRREQTLNAIGGFATGAEPIQTIFINDPVAGVSYTLDSRKQVAVKTSTLKIESRLFPSGAPIMGHGPAIQRFEYKMETKKGATGETTVAPVPMPEGVQFTIKTESGDAGFTSIRRKIGEDSNAVKESLGRQLVEGIQADGTRVTVTIPAGEIGNERPILIVSENWYSPELQAIVMSRNSDPRSGETTYRLTNINRSEPEKSLFEVPPGYTVSEGLPGVLKQAPLPTKVRKPVNPE